MAFLDDQRLLETDLRGVHDAGRRDQVDHERAVEHGRQGDGDDLADRDRMKWVSRRLVADFYLATDTKSSITFYRFKSTTLCNRTTSTSTTK